MRWFQNIRPSSTRSTSPWSLRPVGNLLVVCVAAGFLLSACDDEPGGDVPPDEKPSPCEDSRDRDAYPARGTFAVGTTHLTLTETGDGGDGAEAPALIERSVQIWYPAAAAQGEPLSLSDYAGEGASARFEEALDDAPESCLVEETFTYADLDVADAGPRPLLLFSHCLGCMRFSSLNIAAGLASHGYIVAAVDHQGSSWFDEDGLDAGNLNTTELGKRTDDILALLDALTGEAIEDNALVSSIQAQVDDGRIGVFGHSFGSITSANVVTKDQANGRIGAYAGLAAPPSFLVGPKLQEFEIPALLLIAEEDNSISALGNRLIQADYEKLPAPRFLVTFADFGHFSLTNIAGLGGLYMEGCGEAPRQTNRELFTYPDARGAMEESTRTLAAFFDFALNSADAGAQFLQCDAPATVQALLNDE